VALAAKTSEPRLKKFFAAFLQKSRTAPTHESFSGAMSIIYQILWESSSFAAVVV
jgi:hypothetical protein